MGWHMIKEGKKIIAEKEKLLSELKQFKTFYHSIILAAILGVLVSYIATIIFEFIQSANFWTKFVVDGSVILFFFVLLRIIYNKFKLINERINSLIDSIEQDKNILEYYKTQKKT